MGGSSSSSGALNPAAAAAMVNPAALAAAAAASNLLGMGVMNMAAYHQRGGQLGGAAGVSGGPGGVLPGLPFLPTGAALSLGAGLLPPGFPATSSAATSSSWSSRSA